MLEHLFGSKTRLKLLTLFLHHPDEAFYVRELTRRIDTQINAVRREIQNLLMLGMICEGMAEAQVEDSSVKRPGLKRKYYKANKQFPLFREVCSLLTKAHVLLEKRFDDRIKRTGDFKYVAFMGAFLGTPNQGIDLFIIGKVEEGSFKKIILDLEKEVGFEINYSIMTPQEYIYRKDVADRFLHSILQAPKHVALDNLQE
ncbi:MAG: hypothetical protein ABIB04_04635 [Patescibacteria group bacterium]